MSSEESETKTCNICFETDLETVSADNKIVPTSCNHTFHKECMKKIHKPECPYCRKDITTEMATFGLTKKDIETVIRRKLYAQHIENIDILSEEINTPTEFVDLSLRTYNFSERGTEPYSQLLVEKLKYASQKFYDLYTKCNAVIPNGMFYYHFHSPKDIIMYLSNLKNESRLKWMQLDKAKTSKRFKKYFSEKLDVKSLLKNDKAFYVCIDINNQLPFIVEIPHNDYKKTSPVSLHESRKTLLYCELRRCDCDKSEVYNQEYDQCKKILYSKTPNTISNFVRKSFYNKDKEIVYLTYEDIEKMIDYSSVSDDDDSDDGVDSDDTSSELDLMYLPTLSSKDFKQIKKYVKDNDEPLKNMSYTFWRKLMKSIEIEHIHGHDGAVSYVKIKPQDIKNFVEQYNVNVNVQSILLCTQHIEE